jgi:tetratricopeptide (TPR) repeat protein
MSGDELLRDAQMLFIEGKYRESIDAFTRAIEAGEQEGLCYLSRGVAHIKTGEHDRAIEDFTRCIQMKTGGHRAFYYRGMAHLLKHNFKDAIKDFDDCIRLKNDYARAFFARGVAHAELGNDDEAAKNLKTAMLNSEAALHGFMDTFGIIMTQFDSALSLMTGERRPSSVELSEKETETFKKWLSE